jgi:hypothetical protein
MKTIFTAALSLLPLNHQLRRFTRAIRARREATLEHERIRRLGGRDEVFLHHYQRNEWGNTESVSGPGSTLEYTRNIRSQLPGLVSELGVRSILDAPCGDYNWFQTIKFDPEVSYFGGDIVRPLVEKNEAAFASPKVSFRTLDICRDSLPEVDLWLCRDCMFHLSDREIALTVNNFIRSKIKYLLTSTHPRAKRNRDIPAGSFRLLNLELEPFSFGAPATAIEDWIPGFPERQLAMWDRLTLAERLARNEPFQRILAAAQRAG